MQCGVINKINVHSRTHHHAFFSLLKQMLLLKTNLKRKKGDKHPSPPSNERLYHFIGKVLSATDGKLQKGFFFFFKNIFSLGLSGLLAMFVYFILLNRFQDEGQTRIWFSS